MRLNKIALLGSIFLLATQSIIIFFFSEGIAYLAFLDILMIAITTCVFRHILKQKETGVAFLGALGLAVITLNATYDLVMGYFQNTDDLLLDNFIMAPDYGLVCFYIFLTSSLLALIKFQKPKTRAIINKLTAFLYIIMTIIFFYTILTRSDIFFDLALLILSIIAMVFSIILLKQKENPQSYLYAIIILIISFIEGSYMGFALIKMILPSLMPYFKIYQEVSNLSYPLTNFLLGISLIKLLNTSKEENINK